MSYKKIFLIIFFFLNTNSYASGINLNKDFIPLKDFIVLKFDLFFQKNIKNIYKSSGLMVAYQNIDQDTKIDNKNNITVVINAYMSKKRYTSKKYYPKISDCNQIRNKLYVNKFGYSFFKQQLNKSVNPSNLFNSISEDILNISNLSGDQKKKILDQTKIKIKIFHPKPEKSLSCGGNILDSELNIIN